MSQTSPCPGRAVLDRLRAGALGTQEQKAAETHCDGCTACQAILEELAYDEEGNPRPIPCPALDVLKRYLGYHNGSISVWATLKRSLGLIDSSISVHAYEALEHHLATCQRCNDQVGYLCFGMEPGPRPISCPEPMMLERLLDGLISGHEKEEIERHLESCESCQARLDEITGGGLSLQGQMCNLRPDAAVHAPGLKRVIGALKDEFEPDSDATHSAVSAPSDDLSFLDSPDAPGELGKLGPYRVQEVLGQGGMGIVMKAFDPTLHRAVAIKILAPELAASSSARQRFAREAKAAAAIRNEHVVAIHSVDEWKGLPYLVMEFIPGSSLQARIDRTAPLDLNSILRIGMQAATGLAAAHGQGLVHRDIKPSNILLENCVERVKITDFGLARAVDDASLTQSGFVAGTPLFMAPEQARCETIDHRADLFSLGAVLYAMCTGRSPFRASTTLGVLRRVCDDTHRPVQEVNPDVPNWLSQIIDKLLAKDREARYQTAEEVVNVLGKHLARRQRGVAESPEARPIPSPQQFAPVDDVGPAKVKSRCRKWLEILGATVVVLAGLFVVVVAIRFSRSQEPIAGLLGLRKSKGMVVIHMPYPDLRVLLNGRPLVPGVVIQSKAIVAGGYLVEVFRGEVKTTTKWFDLKPGMMVELEVLKDGTINFEYDGPIRSPLPGMPKSSMSGGKESSVDRHVDDPVTESLRITKRQASIVVHSWNPDLRVLLNDQVLKFYDGTYRLSTKLNVQMVGYTVVVFNDGVKLASEHFYLKPGMLVELQVLKNGEIKYVYEGPMPIQSEAEPRILDNARPSGPDGRPIGARSSSRWQSATVRGLEPSAPAPGTEAHERLVARIAQGIRNDPHVMSLLEQINSLNKSLEHDKKVTANHEDPAIVANQKQLDRLRDEYNNNVQAISERLRARMQMEQNMPDSETP